MKQSEKILCIFLASLFVPTINDNLWSLSGISFWLTYAFYFVIAFVGMYILFIVCVNKKSNKTSKKI
jgi:hypothetical protein